MAKKSIPRTTRAIELKIQAKSFKSIAGARGAVSRAKLPAKETAYLMSLIDNWQAQEEKGEALPSKPEGVALKLPLMSIAGTRGPSHFGITDPIDRAAYTLLIYAVKNKVSMTDAFNELKRRVDSIAIDG